MERSEQIRFDKLYQKHLASLKLQGKSKSTIDLYSSPLDQTELVLGVFRPE